MDSVYENKQSKKRKYHKRKNKSDFKINEFKKIQLTEGIVDNFDGSSKIGGFNRIDKPNKTEELNVVEEIDGTLTTDENDEIMGSFDLISDEQIEILAKFIIIKKEGNISDRTSNKLLELMGELTKSCKWPKTMKAVRVLMEKFVPVVSNLYDGVQEEHLTDGKLLKFNFMSNIDFVVKKNIKYLLPQVKTNGELMEINLLLHSDGGQLSKSSRIEIWSINRMILNLPKRVRLSFSNTIIFSIWLSNGKPNYGKLCRHLIDGFTNSIRCVSYRTIKNDGSIIDGKFYFKINIDKFTGDIPATRKLNNMVNFNGHFECTFCYAKGIYQKGIDGKNGKFTYNDGKFFKLRSNDKYKKDLFELMTNNYESYYGIQGKSYLMDVLKVPEAICIDSMHTVFAGPVKDDLFRIRDGYHKMDGRCDRFKVLGLPEYVMEQYDGMIKKTKLPMEFKRSLRSLRELNFFKSSELKVFMMVRLPTVLTEVISLETKHLILSLLLLNCGVLSLMDDNLNEGKILMAEKCLSDWFSERVKLIGHSAKVMKSHLITHLGIIARRHGNITNYGCFSGEGLMHVLANLVSQVSEKNSLSQIKARMMDFQMTSFVLMDKYEKSYEKVVPINNLMMDTCRSLNIDVNDCSFFDGVFSNSYFIKCCYKKDINVDGFLIYERNDGNFNAGLLLAVFNLKKKKTKKIDGCFKIKIKI
uniref:DUF4806 domain-containing protein n=1 Tax=Strongyloides stercoralis TaxID=6248 RepID=A0A0K0EA86_STRER